MRIDRIQLENFKCFGKESFVFHPQFTLFVGENGAGKSSILSAVAVALGIWDQNEVVKTAEKTWRKIYEDEVRLIPAQAGDRGLFQPAELCEVLAEWDQTPEGKPIRWSRLLENGRRKNIGSEIITAIDKMVRDAQSQTAPAPLLAFYGAGRTWMPSNERANRAQAGLRKPKQWDGYYDCLQERIRLKDLNQWFRDEAAARDEKGGWRPGYKTVVRAILNCVPGAEEVVWDADRLEICLEIAGKKLPFSLLSDGQKSMSAMVADLAIRAVTLNSFLFGDEKEIPKPPALPVVLAQTPGVVLIDEIDVHLHPKWQRQVVDDLRRTFPRVQFICTSHSPQIVGEVAPESLRIFDPESKKWQIPGQSFGMDSNWILRVLMGGAAMDQDTEKDLKEVLARAARKETREARELLSELRARVGNSEQIQFATSTLARIELLGK